MSLTLKSHMKSQYTFLQLSEELHHRRTPTYVDHVAKEVVHKCCFVGETLLNQDCPNHRDHVNNYACVLCHFGPLALEFTDAWSEGDGEHTSFNAGVPHASVLCSQAYQVCTASTSVETSVGITTSYTCIPAEVESLCTHPWWAWTQHPMQSSQRAYQQALEGDHCEHGGQPQERGTVKSRKIHNVLPSAPERLLTRNQVSLLAQLYTALD